MYLVNVPVKKNLLTKSYFSASCPSFWGWHVLQKKDSYRIVTYHHRLVGCSGLRRYVTMTSVKGVICWRQAALRADVTNKEKYLFPYTLPQKEKGVADSARTFPLSQRERSRSVKERENLDLTIHWVACLPRQERTSPRELHLSRASLSLLSSLLFISSSSLHLSSRARAPRRPTSITSRRPTVSSGVRHRDANFTTGLPAKT